ncbi:unnamed protein product, partial [Candidula unifasciata]
ALKEVVADTELTCLNDGRSTRIPDREGDTDSDLALVSDSMSARCHWGALGHHGNDHLPCSILIKDITRTRSQKSDASSKYQTDATGYLRDRVRRTPGSKEDVYQQPPWWTPEVTTAWTEKQCH